MESYYDSYLDVAAHLPEFRVNGHKDNSTLNVSHNKEVSIEFANFKSTDRVLVDRYWIKVIF